MGVSTNLEGFAKSVFNQSALNTFNKLNTLWLVVYFFLLQTLQSFGLEGVMVSYIIFYWMRCFIAVGLASSIDPQLNWRIVMAKFLPSTFECLSYPAALFLSHLLMSSLADPFLGFLACAAIGVCHFAGLAYMYRSELRDFKAAIHN